MPREVIYRQLRPICHSAWHMWALSELSPRPSKAIYYSPFVEWLYVTQIPLLWRWCWQESLRCLIYLLCTTCVKLTDKLCDLPSLCSNLVTFALGPNSLSVQCPSHCVIYTLGMSHCGFQDLYIYSSPPELLSRRSALWTLEPKPFCRKMKLF